VRGVNKSTVNADVRRTISGKMAGRKRRREKKQKQKNKILEGGMGLTKFELFCPKDFSRYAKLLWNDGLGGREGEEREGAEAGLGIGPSADKIGEE